MKNLRAIILLAPLTAIAGEHPPHMAVEEAYFECLASKSLQGGIFGKGPLRKFGPQPGTCSEKQWQKVSREQFKIRATQWCGTNWERDIPFFKASNSGQSQ